MKNIKLIVSDIDGVWTDGSFYYSAEGDSLRKFSTKDSYGVVLSTLAEIPVLILSGEKNAMVKQRMKKLGIKHLKLGVKNKTAALTAFCTERGIELQEVAFIGDDMNDYHLLGKLQLFACPADAYPAIKEKADKVLSTKGGEGVFREFVEYILQKQGVLGEVYEKYLKLHE